MPSPHRRDNIKKKLVDEGRMLVCIPCFLDGVQTRYARSVSNCPVCRRTNDKAPEKADKVVKVTKVRSGIG